MAKKIYLEAFEKCAGSLCFTLLTSCEKGDTNLIMVDRENILETGIEEILVLKDKFTTLEVQFYGEVSLFHYIVFSFLLINVLKC